MNIVQSFVLSCLVYICVDNRIISYEKQFVAWNEPMSMDINTFKLSQLAYSALYYSYYRSLIEEKWDILCWLKESSRLIKCPAPV